jgi:hypothetical protein
MKEDTTMTQIINNIIRIFCLVLSQGKLSVLDSDGLTLVVLTIADRLQKILIVPLFWF